MLPDRRLIAVRVRTDGRTHVQVQRAPVAPETLMAGLSFWASLFAACVIGGLL